MRENAGVGVERRRHLIIGLALTALVVGVAIPLLRVDSDPERRAAPAPTVPPRPDVGRSRPPVVYDLDFAGERHGFALWGRCTDGVDFRCERRLLVTEDGVHWRQQAFAEPELAAPRRLTGRVVALGGDRLVLTDLGAGGPHDRYFSADGGRTWRVAATTPDLRVSTIPADAVLETRCMERVRTGADCWWRRLVVTLPDSGERAWLANPPALDGPRPEPRAAADGSWWVTGRDPRSSDWNVAVSRDNGASWSVAVLPTDPNLLPAEVTVTGSGPNVYALATGRRADGWESRSLFAIYRSTDGGRTWTQTWSGTGGQPRTLGGTAVVQPDGALFIAPNDVGPAYRSTDGGRSFQPILDGPRLNSLRRTRSGYLANASGGDGGRFLSSPDGVRWSDVRFR
ncbi:sialidase family protein [Actinophytocola sp.]|uniref:sialidase family protein n=1 Tax=Actinophytocola sp. TaxID=1872138 RepID=UPI002D7F8F3B|nr:sialidase family protein [Actinophytocola sp.]HET9141423.1 sialidase family protein [Actinophytocola sp.]